MGIRAAIAHLIRARDILTLFNSVCYLLRMDTSPKFSPELFARLCKIVGGGVTVTQACKDVGVDRSNLWRWLQEGSKHYDAIKDKWAEALELQAHAGFDELERMAEPVPGEDAVSVAARRLQADTRKWRLSKMHKRYSDKSESHVTIDAKIATTDMTDDQLIAIAASAIKSQ